MARGFSVSALLLFALSPFEVQASACIISKEHPFPKGNCNNPTYICAVRQGVTRKESCQNATDECQCTYENFLEIGNAAIAKRNHVCGSDRNGTHLAPGRRIERREELQRIVGADEKNKILPLMKGATSIDEVHANIIEFYTSKDIWSHAVACLISLFFFLLWVLICSWSSFPCCRKSRLRIKHRGRARLGTRFICCTFVFFFGLIMVYAAYFAWNGMDKIDVVVNDVTCSAAQSADHIVNGSPSGLSKGFRGGVSALNDLSEFLESESTVNTLKYSFTDSTRHDLLAGALEDAKRLAGLTKGLAETGTLSEEFLYHGYAAKDFLNDTEADRTNGIPQAMTDTGVASKLKQKLNLVANATRQMTTRIEAVYDRNLGNPSRRILDLAADEKHGAPGTYMTDILEVGTRQMQSFADYFSLAFVITMGCTIILFVTLQSIAVVFCRQEIVSDAKYRRQGAERSNVRDFAKHGLKAKFNYENPYNTKLKNLGGVGWCAAYLFGCLLLLLGGVMQSALVVPSGACEIFSAGFTGENKLEEFEFLSPVTRKLLGECIDTKGDGSILEIFTTKCPPGSFPFNTSKCDSAGVMTIMEAIDAYIEYAESIMPQTPVDASSAKTTDLTKFEAPKLKVASEVTTIEPSALLLIDPTYLPTIKNTSKFAMLDFIPAAYVTGTACSDVHVAEDPELHEWLATSVPKTLTDKAGVTNDFRQIIGLKTFKGYLESMTYRSFSHETWDDVVTNAKSLSQKLQEDEPPRPKTATVCHDDFSTASGSRHRRLQSEQDSVSNIQCPTLDLRNMTEADKRGIYFTIYHCVNSTGGNFTDLYFIAQNILTVDTSKDSPELQEVQEKVNSLMNRDSDPSRATCDPCQVGVNVLKAKLALRAKQHFPCNHFMGFNDSLTHFQTRELVELDRGSKSYKYTPDELPDVVVKTCNFTEWSRNMRNLPLHFQEATKRFTGDAPFDWFSEALRDKTNTLKASLASCSTIYEQSLQMNDALCFGAIYYAFILPSSYIVVGLCSLILGLLGFCMWRHVSDNYHAYEEKYAKRRIKAKADDAMSTAQSFIRFSQSANTEKDESQDRRFSCLQPKGSFEDLEMSRAGSHKDATDEEPMSNVLGNQPSVTFSNEVATVLPTRRRSLARRRKSAGDLAINSVISDMTVWSNVDDAPTSVGSPYSSRRSPLSPSLALQTDAKPLPDYPHVASPNKMSSIGRPCSSSSGFELPAVSEKRARRSSRQCRASSGDEKSSLCDFVSVGESPILKPTPVAIAHNEGAANNVAQTAHASPVQAQRRCTRKRVTISTEAKINTDCEVAASQLVLKDDASAPVSENDKSQGALGFEHPGNDGSCARLSELAETPYISLPSVSTIQTTGISSPKLPPPTRSGPTVPHLPTTPPTK